MKQLAELADSDTTPEEQAQVIEREGDRAWSRPPTSMRSTEIEAIRVLDENRPRRWWWKPADAAPGWPGAVVRGGEGGGVILRNYQQEALDTLWRYLRHADGNPALVLPTGAGKSPLMAAIAKEAVQNWQGRGMVLAHVQELVAQNAAKMTALAPAVDYGIYAAGLRRRDRFNRVLLPDSSTPAPRRSATSTWYWWTKRTAFRSSPRACTARSSRTCDALTRAARGRPDRDAVPPAGRSGAVCGPDNVLTEIAYEARVGDLIRDGFLSPLVSKAGARPDLSAVKLRGGEYVEASLADGRCCRWSSAPSPTCSPAHKVAKAGIVFCVNVAHAEAVLDALHAAGETAALVHGQTRRRSAPR